MIIIRVPSASPNGVGLVRVDCHSWLIKLPLPSHTSLYLKVVKVFSDLIQH